MLNIFFKMIGVFQFFKIVTDDVFGCIEKWKKYCKESIFNKNLISTK